MTTTKNDNLNYSFETSIPEAKVQIDLRFSKKVFKEKFRLLKFKHQMLKAKEEVFETWFNSYPRHNINIKSPFLTFRNEYREYLIEKQELKRSARAYYLAYAFLRGIPRRVLEKKTKEYNYLSPWKLDDLAHYIFTIVKSLSIQKTEIAKGPTPLKWKTSEDALQPILDDIKEWLKA